MKCFLHRGKLITTENIPVSAVSDYFGTVFAYTAAIRAHNIQNIYNDSHFHALGCLLNMNVSYNKGLNLTSDFFLQT
jgi:hypothetical protein